MLPSTGYFKAISCPFYDNGYCERPYCHFRHSRRVNSFEKDGVSSSAVVTSDSGQLVQKPQNADSASMTATNPDVIQQLVSEAVKKVLVDQNVTDTENIVNKVVEGLKPKLVPVVLSTSSAIKQETGLQDSVVGKHVGVPSVVPTTKASQCVYNPTPIAELKKRHIPITAYEPTRESKAVKRKSPDVERPWMSVIRNISGLKESKVRYKPTAINQTISKDNNSTHGYVPTLKSDNSLNLYINNSNNDSYIPEKKKKKELYCPKPKKRREEYVPRKPKIPLKDEQHSDDDVYDVFDDILHSSESNRNLAVDEESQDLMQVDPVISDDDGDDVSNNLKITKEETEVIVNKIFKGEKEIKELKESHQTDNEEVNIDSNRTVEESQNLEESSKHCKDTSKSKSKQDVKDNKQQQKDSKHGKIKEEYSKNVTSKLEDAKHNKCKEGEVKQNKSKEEEIKLSKSKVDDIKHSKNKEEDYKCIKNKENSRHGVKSKEDSKHSKSKDKDRGDEKKNRERDKDKNKEKDKHKHSSRSIDRERSSSSSKDSKSKDKDRDKAKSSQNSSRSCKDSSHRAKKDSKSDKEKSYSLKDSKENRKEIKAKDSKSRHKSDDKSKHKSKSSSSDIKNKSSKQSHKSSDSRGSHSSHKSSKENQIILSGKEDSVSEKMDEKLDQNERCDSPEYEEFSPFYDDQLLETSDSDHDVEEECRKIFQEFEVSDQPKDVIISKTPISEVNEVDEIFKKRIAHPSAILNTTKQVGPSQPIKRLSNPQQRMYERWRMMKEIAAEKAAEKVAAIKDAALQKKSDSASGVQNDHQINGNGRIRIAQVPYAMSLAMEKKKVLQQVSKVETKTVAQNKKGGARVAHIPQVVPQLIRPEPLQISGTQKFPLNVRQFYLNAMQDICIQIYTNAEDAMQRAVREEVTSYEKCKALNVYKNSCMLTVHRLRKEVDQKSEDSLASYSGLISHEAVLAGKVKGSWSVIKQKKSITDFKGATLYQMLSKWIMTDQDLKDNGYPRPHPDGPKGRAKLYVLNTRGQSTLSKVPNERFCCRCYKPYIIDKNGFPLRKENCIYHYARKFTFRGESKYMCCKQDGSSDGCCDATSHVWDHIDVENLRGYVSTFHKDNIAAEEQGVFALDCEMCYTTQGLELTRITVIDENCQVVYETLVKPAHPIIDYNTRFSGISEENMINVTTILRDVQATLLSMFSSKTILIGHSLESDFKALKLLHNTVVDTSIMFPHKNGPPYKRALKTLCSEYLRKIIQNDVGGHDSKEDAASCMELVLWKVKEEAKLQ